MQIIENEVRNKWNTLSKLLIDKNISISIMESCTSGLIASLITDVDNSSKIFRGSFVTYSNEAKILNGVNKNTIEKFGVYSKEVVKEMASSCKKIYKSKIGIGVSGSLGIVDENNSGSVKGEVFFAIDFEDEIFTYKYVIENQGEKYKNKFYVADIISDRLLELVNTQII